MKTRSTGGSRGRRRCLFVEMVILRAMEAFLDPSTSVRMRGVWLLQIHRRRSSFREREAFSAPSLPAFGLRREEAYKAPCCRVGILNPSWVVEDEISVNDEVLRRRQRRTRGE
ncbi:hypothetical protein Bca101_083896 [Brassica carinata]